MLINFFSLSEFLNKRKAGVLMGTALALATPKAMAGPKSVELFGGSKSATIDLKVGGNVAGPVDFFARHINDLDYETKIFDPFTLAYLQLISSTGFYAAAGFETPGNNFGPRLGAGFGGSNSYFSGFVESSYGPRGADLLLLTGLDVEKMRLTDDIAFVPRFEMANLFDKTGRVFGVLRFRPNFNYHTFGFGIGADFKEQGDLTKTETRLGAFFNVNL